MTRIYQRMQQAAKQTTGEVLPRGGDQKSEEAKRNLRSDSQPARAQENGVSRRTQQRLDKLARHWPDLLAQVRAGELSVHRACIQAGYVKELTPLQAAIRAWNKLSAEERVQFRAFIREQQVRAA